MITIFSHSFSHTEFILLCLIALLVGMAKTGIGGTAMIAVPLLATIFGGKASSGVMLPILIMADVFGVSYYHKHTEWKHLKKLLPYAVIGILIGTFTGEYIDDSLFKVLMGGIIFLSLGILIWLERTSSGKVPESKLFAASSGIAGGFTTMVGNLAGAVMSLYLLAMQLPKNKFIGTAAWFFITVNIIKIPFHVVVWKTITWDTVLLDLTLLPAIALGAFLGLQIVKRIPELWYRYFIILMTAVAAIFMLI